MHHHAGGAQTSTVSPGSTTAHSALSNNPVGLGQWSSAQGLFRGDFFPHPIQLLMFNKVTLKFGRGEQSIIPASRFQRRIFLHIHNISCVPKVLGVFPTFSCHFCFDDLTLWVLFGLTSLWEHTNFFHLPRGSSRLFWVCYGFFILPFYFSRKISEPGRCQIKYFGFACFEEMVLIWWLRARKRSAPFKSSSDSPQWVWDDHTDTFPSNSFCNI